MTQASVSSTDQGGGKWRDGMRWISSSDGAPEILHKADGVIDRADGNNDEHGKDEAVEEVGERANVGQEGFNALVHRRLRPAPNR